MTFIKEDFYFGDYYIPAHFLLDSKSSPYHTVYDDHVEIRYTTSNGDRKYYDVAYCVKKDGVLPDVNKYCPQGLIFGLLRSGQ